MTMIRKQIYLEPRQDALVKRLAEARGTTEADIIREAIDSHARGPSFREHRLGVWQRERAFIARLMEESAEDGKRAAEAGRQWRREDLYDR
jgi:hypothetical protein